MDQIIEVIVKPDGSVKIETFGFTGSACEAATQHLLDAIKGAEISDARTAEFYVDEKLKVSR